MESSSTEKSLQLEELLKASSLLGRKDLMSVFSIKNNPLSIMIIKKYSVNDKLNATMLIEALYGFVNSKSLDEKLKFIFDVYDGDGDGYISSVELFEILKILNKGILDDWKLQNVVDKTFAAIGEYTTMMKFEQFKNLIVKRSNRIHEMFDCNE